MYRKTIDLKELAKDHFRGLNVEEVQRLLPEGLILLGYRGSLAHGTYTPQEDPDSIDDKDCLGVFIGSLDHYFGYKQREQRECMIREWDAVSYEFRKYVKLLSQANPNVLSLLWLNPQHHIGITPMGQELIANRHLFATKKIYHSFTGYACAQLKKMTAYQRDGYMGEKRKQLVDKFGYDCKNASHLIRLLRMGIEFLREGKLHVYREDAPQLIEIKRGRWTLEQVKEEANMLFKRAEQAYDECKLPNQPDTERINNFVVDLLRNWFAG
jgi:predicted nucleotidyltransferase